MLVLVYVLVNRNLQKGEFFVQTCKYTGFGLCVKTELLKRGWEQKFLAELVSKDSGLYVDNGYMYKILTGQRTPKKVITSISKILEIPVP